MRNITKTRIRHGIGYFCAVAWIVPILAPYVYVPIMKSMLLGSLSTGLGFLLIGAVFVLLNNPE